MLSDMCLPQSLMKTENIRIFRYLYCLNLNHLIYKIIFLKSQNNQNGYYTCNTHNFQSGYDLLKRKLKGKKCKWIRLHLFV